MSLSLPICALCILGLAWITVHALLIPKPIPGIPYSVFSRCMPWGELGALGIYNWRTGEVFSWLSRQCLKQKAPLVQLFMPPFSTTHPTLVLADLGEIENIVTRRVGEIDRADMMHLWFGLVAPRATIGLKSRDVRFREQRRLWNVVLSPVFLEDVAAERFHEAANVLCDLWSCKASIAGPEHAFEAQEDIRLATLDAVWKLCVGSGLGLLDASLEALDRQTRKSTRGKKVVFEKGEMPPFYHTLGTLLICLDWVMQGVTPLGYTWFFRVTGILGRAEKKKDAILDDYLAASRSRVLAGWRGTPCALDEVLRKDIRLHGTANVPSLAASNAALRDEFLELLITGHETTASSIAWALKYLSDHPTIQTQLRDSLHAAFLDTDPCALPSARDIAKTNLPYLDAVIAEILRISATGPVSFRQTIVPCEIMGYQIPASTPIILVTAGPSYNSPHMPKASQSELRQTNSSHEKSSPLNLKSPLVPSLHTFSPDRWLVDGVFNPKAVHMLPFSAGPRGCFGKKIALLEMKIMLAIFALRFDFPKLEKELSRYGAWDGLTRRPTCCYVRPKEWREEET